MIGAIAVGIAGAFVGASLTAAPSPEPIPAAATETRTVPVISPVGIGENAPPINDDEDTFTVSDAIGEREVGVSGGDGDTGIPFSEIAESEDLGAMLGTGPTGAGGDPCARREGEADDACPDGIRGTVFSLMAPPDLFVSGIAWPPTLEALIAGDSSRGNVWCDPETPPADGEVPLGVITPVPATLTITYWPTADPADVRSGPTVTTPAAARSAWQSGFDDGTLLAGDWLQHCFTLPEIEPGIQYTARAIAVDLYDRVAVSRDIRFHGDGAPTRPSLAVHGLGNLMFASAMHALAESVTIRAFQFPLGTTPNCDGAGGRTLHPLTNTTTTVTADQLVAQNILPMYVRKLTQPYHVQEGATMLVCARWFPAGGSPSWQRDQPTFASEVLAESPDRILPVVTLEGATLTGDPSVQSIGLGITSAEGTGCGYAGSQVFPESPLPLTLCSSHAFSHGGARYHHERGLISDVGFRGDLVVTARVELERGDSAENTVLLPLRDLMCIGGDVCALPAPRWYSIVLPKVEEITGLCGSVFGSGCTPPSRDVVAGTALIKVAWDRGNTNNRRTWSVLPPVDSSLDYERPDLPQLNTEKGFTVTVNPANRDATATLELQVDRPVDYTLRLGTIDGPGACVHEGGSLVLTGRLERSATISISRLCIGEDYLASIELVDDAGRTAVWGLVDRETWWGGNAMFDVPGHPVNLNYSWIAQGYSQSRFTNFELGIGGHSFDATDARAYPCTTDGIVSKSGGREATLSDRVMVRVQFRMPAANFRADGTCAPRPGEESPLLSHIVTVSLYDLLSPGGVVVRISEPYAFQVTIRAVTRRD